MLTLKSPAKVNLFLRILDKRSDGYHDLASLFQTIDLFDTVHVGLSDDDRITCTSRLIPTDESNLIIKAAKLFRLKTGIEKKLHVHLVKRIPTEAGLGGGSSNAATALWAYNELCDKPASLQDLMNWSSELGSDVPFFFSEGTAYCTGRGEKVHLLPPIARKKLWIVKPQFGLPTGDVYERVNPPLDLHGHNELFNLCLEKKEIYFNDLESAAFSLKPQLAKLKNDLLAKGFHTVVMSGSGSSFFCLGELSMDLLIPHITSFNVSFINRIHGQWY